jgi:hypothetical protein
MWKMATPLTDPNEIAPSMFSVINLISVLKHTLCWELIIIEEYAKNTNETYEC